MTFLRLFILIFLSYKFINTTKYSIDEIFDIFNKLTTDESDLKIIIEAFSSFFKDIYSFYEVAKNPPQPSFDNEYHKKINIQEGLKNIKTKDTNMYKFYQELKLLFDSLGDQHLYIINDYLKMNKVYFTDPLKLSIKTYENKARMFADVKVSSYDYSYFRNYEIVFKTIQNNINTPIKTINGKDPFDFITNFAGDYERLKSPQGTFRYKLYDHNNEQDFFDYPLSKENFINFTVVYENGDNFTTDYIIYSDKILTEEYFRENFKSFINKIKGNMKSDNNLKKKFDPNDFLIARSEKLYRKLKRKPHFQVDNKKVSLSNSNSNWEYNYRDYIACRVDNINKINIYGVTSFSSDTSYQYAETIKKCTFLFDKNKFPIIVVNVFNGGGYVYNSQYLLELLSPRTELNIYGMIRKSILSKDNYITEQIAQSLVDIKKCEPFKYKSLMKTEQKINYGNSVSDTLLGPFIFNGKNFVEDVNIIKQKLKNPRKPTEILIYTDGFSYSATSLLLKYMQYYGGAITAGYICNPNLDNIPYDSSLSPSSILSPDLLKLLNHKGYETLNEKYNFDFVIAGTQTFYNLNNFKRPLEYEVTPVDEKVNIFFEKVYKDYEYFNPNDFDIFINESLRIFEKYKTQCNPNNKKLLLITNECDGKFGKHAHGGYECGDDGFWTTKCVASYCDIGYIYDFNKKKCVDNACKPEDIKQKFLIAFIIIASIIILSIISLCICIKVKDINRKKKLAMYYKKREDMKIEENLNSNKENLISEQ